MTGAKAARGGGKGPEPRCPCGGAAALEDCCGRWMQSTPAPDAERLMRSRFTAYVRGDGPYLLATWHPTTRPLDAGLDQLPRPRWLDLRVLRHEVRDADHAVVEFIARYTINGRAHRLHETSRFERIGDRWYYLDGDVA